MKILTIVIKQKQFDKIISGNQKVITRKVRPSTARKYLIFNQQGQISDLIKYDAIRVYGRVIDPCNTALVEVNDTHLVVIVDDNNNPIFYNFNGCRSQLLEIDYSLGTILEKTIS